jgi:C1A family cysteine protease
MSDPYLDPDTDPEPIHIFNVKIDRIDPSKLRLKPETRSLRLPRVVDLRSKLPPVYNQGNLGSCTANALVAAFAYKAPGFMGSRLFLYYNTRKMENNIQEDAGAYIYNAVACLQTSGLCLESQWPYVISRFKVQPTTRCYTEGRKHRAVTVYNIKNTMTSMKNCLHSGLPFVVGFAVYSSFESNTVTRSGMVPMPGPNERLLGGHAVLICGYTDTKQCWIARNSWGASWGDRGYFYLPYAYLLDSNLSSDLWNITSVTR